MSVARLRFCPSPSGDLHVGNVRTALFNWAYARHVGGTFVFRIEDTDTARVTPDAIAGAAEVLRWLGLDWDEGPEVGGAYAPYLQSERRDLYAGVVSRLLASGAAYPCYCSKAELDERAAQARAAKQPPGYDGRCRALSDQQIEAFQADGRIATPRFRMPDGTTEFVDVIRGPMSFDNALIPDFALTRPDGSPLYPLANPVDDVLMKITHVVRGEDLLSSTPRQIALYRAMGVTELPVFAHLPFVMGADNAKLSKRNGEVSIAYYRREGFLPEALVNYLALLGWSLDAERELFDLTEMTGAFELSRVQRNPAKFDIKKLESVNGDKIRALTEDDLAGRLLPFLQLAGLVSDPATSEQLATLTAAVPLVQTRMDRLTTAVDLLRFAFVDEDAFVIDPTAAAKALTADNAVVLAEAAGALEPLATWTTESIQRALDGALVHGGLLMSRRKAYLPLRAAVCGESQSPPLPESMALLGHERTVHRLRAAAARAAAGPVG